MPAASKRTNIPALLQQGIRTAFSEEVKQWGQDELLDTLFWMRQLIALLCGIVWGLIPLKGLPAFLGFVAVFYGIMIAWTNHQQIDPDDFGGSTVIFGEGVPPGLGLFTLVWIATYTAVHT